MKKIRNVFTGSNYAGKVCVQPSETIPDQTMDMRTILKRYARGLPITGETREPEYHGEEGTGIDPRHLDLVEQVEMAENAKNAIKKHLKGKEVARLKSDAEKLKKEAIEEFERQQKDLPKTQH